MIALLYQEMFHIPMHTYAFRNQDGSQGLKIVEIINDLTQPFSGHGNSLLDACVSSSTSELEL